MKTKNEELNIYELEDLYRPSDDVFCDDSNLYYKIKYILFNVLSETDRRIIICYAHTGSLRETAKLFNVSTSTIFGYVHRIKKIIKNNLKQQ